MRKATIRIRRDTDAVLKEMARDSSRRENRGRPAGDVLTLEVSRCLFRALTPKRWELIERAYRASIPCSVRGLARAARPRREARA